MQFKHDVTVAGALRKGQIFDLNGDYHRVAAVVHPQGKHQSGTVIVTYMRNGLKTVTFPVQRFIGTKRKPRRIYV